MASAMAMAKGKARRSQGVRSSVGVVMGAVIMASMLVGEGGADSTIQNLAKASVTVNSHVLAAGETLTIAISRSGGTAAIDLAYTKNITGLKIENSKEYFVVQNQAGTTALLAGQSVVALDLVQAKIVESAF